MQTPAGIRRLRPRQAAKKQAGPRCVLDRLATALYFSDSAVMPPTLHTESSCLQYSSPRFCCQVCFFSSRNGQLSPVPRILFSARADNIR